MPTSFGTMSLGEVIDALDRAEPGAIVKYDFCYTSPTTVASYRGWYDHLALGWQAATMDAASGTYWPLASTILERLEKAVGETFEGYKGGSYEMDRDTPLWIANYSDTGSTGIVEIECDGSTVIIHTKRMDI